MRPHAKIKRHTISADLWVSGESLPTENMSDTGKNTSVQYAVGQAEGSSHFHSYLYFIYT